MTTDLRPLARPLLLLLALVALVVSWAAPAFAHTELRASTPEEGSTVEQLSELRVEFTSDVLDIGAELTVVDADGMEHELEPEFPSFNAVTGTLDRDLPAGETLLEWRVVAEDGHEVEGVVTFTYAPSGDSEATAPSPSPDATASAEPAPQVTESSPEPSASAVPAQEDEGEQGDLPGWVLPVIALAAAGGALVAILAARARQK